MPILVIFDDEHTENLRPLTSIMPCCEISLGIFKLRHMLEDMLSTAGITITRRVILIQKNLEKYINVIFNIDDYDIKLDKIDDDVLFVNSRVVPSPQLLDILIKIAKGVYCNVIDYATSKILLSFIPLKFLHNYIPLEHEFPYRKILKEFPNLYVTGIPILHRPGDIIKYSLNSIKREINLMLRLGNYEKFSRSTFVGKNTYIESNILMDDSWGPILVGKDVYIEAGSIIRGPCIIGDNTYVGKAVIFNSIIGQNSVIGGNISTSVISDNTYIGSFSLATRSYISFFSIIGTGTMISTNRIIKRKDSEQVGLITGPFTIIGPKCILPAGTLLPPFSIVQTMTPGAIAISPFIKKELDKCKREEVLRIVNWFKEYLKAIVEGIRHDNG